MWFRKNMKPHQIKENPQKISPLGFRGKIFLFETRLSLTSLEGKWFMRNLNNRKKVWGYKK